MKGKPLYPFAVTAVLGIGLIIILSFVGINMGDQASENGENNEAQEFDDPIELGESLYQNSCVSCHGGDLEGASGPALDGGNLSHEDILNAISEGPGTMPPDLVTGEDAEAVAEYILAENE
ncbi:cytochrome c [Salipaludibacillus sp. LMS25]|jgi:cytochrome c550|uniref:c-type cytochrome n=1 Tax=Salipaludibacillus sp. LMS25 TaxID=2924031 RepID=UPI0020D139A2|nr:cytochrome c [Salipaludibacillus sp. LMS25]UTR14391.1 cytochrome c [Salipaludibacillus sp. LMS25]